MNNMFLRSNLSSWILYAKTELEMSEAEATVIWGNAHNKEKYLICEAREDNTTRLFIREVNNLMSDAFKKFGWWNTFTITKTPVNKGIWLAQVIEYRQDHNGFVNLEVEIILPMNDVRFSKTFESYNGTWDSVAWDLMMAQSDMFLEEYNFSGCGHFNICALIDRFPELQGMTTRDIGKTMLFKYLRNEVTMEEIEECLNTLTDEEQLIKDLTIAVIRGTVEKLYGSQYPNFARKMPAQVYNDSVLDLDSRIKGYLSRQYESYIRLLDEGKIKETNRGLLDMIETVLVYREQEKKAKKEAKKAAKKAKKETTT